MTLFLPLWQLYSILDVITQRGKFKSKNNSVSSAFFFFSFFFCLFFLCAPLRRYHDSNIPLYPCQYRTSFRHERSFCSSEPHLLSKTASIPQSCVQEQGDVGYILRYSRANYALEIKIFLLNFLKFFEHHTGYA